MRIAAPAPEAIYLVERTVDLAARELGLAPDELRRRNFVKPADMPYQTPVESRYDSGDFAAVMARAMEKADWTGFPRRREQAKAQESCAASAWLCISSAAAAATATR